MDWLAECIFAKFGADITGRVYCACFGWGSSGSYEATLSMVTYIAVLHLEAPNVAGYPVGSLATAPLSHTA
ncbi:hypothetical protein N7454_003266 [Penicillium verhagenii]|nr:hypothetical protein N7454_003266 [Penicillium verhagenii]